MTGEPKVLVVGGSHAEIPLIKALNDLGYRVITTGNRPSDLGHQFSTAYANVDFSDCVAICELAKSTGVVGVISGCNDLAAISTAFTAQQLGLPGHDGLEQTIRIHHKDQFRQLLEELGLPSPRSVVISDLGSVPKLRWSLNFPVIVKPVDLTGGKGMSVCHHADELGAAINFAFSLTRQQHVIVEEFMDGSRHGYTCFIKQGRVVFWFADDEQYLKNPFLVSGTTSPTTMPDSAISDLRSSVERISQSLNLVDGLVHVQCILTADGPRIIEMCRRCPGDLYPWFVQISTGFDYATAVVKSELGLSIASGGFDPTPVARHCLMAENDGILRSIHIESELAGHIVERMEWWSPGQVVSNHLVEKFGILFFLFDEVDEMRQVVSSLQSKVVVDLLTGSTGIPATTG